MAAPWVYMETSLAFVIALAVTRLVRLLGVSIRAGLDDDGNSDISKTEKEWNGSEEGIGVAIAVKKTVV